MGLRRQEFIPSIQALYVDDRQLALSKKSTLPPQPVSEDDPVTSTEPPMLFSPEKEKLFATRFEEDYDIQDPEYTAWLKINAA